MAKWVAGDVLDGALQIVSGATHMLALPSQPLDFGAAWAGRLADVAMTPADFALATGTGSGRRLDVAGKAGATVQAAGTADHVALVDQPGGRLLYVTTCPAQALATGGTVTFDGWSIEIGAPL